MAMFYRGPTALITKEVFHSGLPDPQWFRVSGLRQVCVMSGRSERANAGVRRGQPIWELRAVYRGRPVLLYATTDVRAFGQIRRALVRALEANQLC
jgi:hypothetical protein